MDIHSAQLLSTCRVPGTVLGLGTSNEHHKPAGAELREFDGAVRRPSAVQAP